MGYKSDAQRKAVHASKADGGKGNPNKLKVKTSPALAKLSASCKAAAKRKFKVYPSAYANMYASGVCSGKITPGGKKGSRKKAAGGGFMSRRMNRYG